MSLTLGNLALVCEIPENTEATELQLFAKIHLKNCFRNLDSQIHKSDLPYNNDTNKCNIYVRANSYDTKKCHITSLTPLPVLAVSVSFC